MARSRWGELGLGTRRFILTVGAIEGLLKIAALVDLVRRPAQDVNGSKRVWAVAIVVINSAGAVPLLYFARGRITPHVSL